MDRHLHRREPTTPPLALEQLRRAVLLRPAAPVGRNSSTWFNPTVSCGRCNELVEDF
jgi:hypothetical protein